MKRFFTRFFVFLGVIFFALICAGAYVWIADPFHVRPLVLMLWQARAGSAEVDASATSMPSAPTGGSAPSAAAPTGTTPKLNAAQADALRAVGIDPAKLPTTITPAQEGCFTSILGAARVAEIKAGRAPTTEEIFAARTCLE